jgi:nitrilase
VVGYYNRFDIFDLRIDRSRRDPARFIEGFEASSSAVEADAGPSEEVLGSAVSFIESVPARR